MTRYKLDVYAKEPSKYDALVAYIRSNFKNYVFNIRDYEAHAWFDAEVMPEASIIYKLCGEKEVTISASSTNHSITYHLQQPQWI